MSKHSLTQSRRSFLKGVAYTSVLAIGGLSGLAFAKGTEYEADSSTGLHSIDSSNSGIGIMQQKTLDGETVTLINQSDKIVMLNALLPITLQQYRGSLIIKVNQVESEAHNGMVAISPGERITFNIEVSEADITNAEILALQKNAVNHLNISSEHSIFNRTVPLQVV